MDEGQDTAVRHSEKTKRYEIQKFREKGCKFEYEMGRTAVTGEQRSVFAARFGQGFPKKAFSKPSKSNGLISAGKRGDPCFCLGYRPSPRMQPYCKFDQYILEGR